MANTISTEEFMGSGGDQVAQQPTIVSTEDFMGSGGGFAQEPVATPTGMSSKESSPVVSSPGKEPSLTGVQKAMQSLYTPLATAVNTGVGLVSWSAGLAGGLWAYADKLASNLGKGDADIESVRAARDVTRQMIQEAIPRMQNTIEGQGAEAGLNMIPGLLKNLSTAIARKTLPATWFEEGAAKAGRKVGTAEKVINDMSDELGDVLSAYMTFHGAGAAAHGVGELGKGRFSVEQEGKMYYANKESDAYVKRSNEIGARFTKGEQVSGDMLDSLIKAHELHKSKIGMPLISTREFMGGGTEGAPPFRGETLGLGDTGGDKIPPRPVIEPQTQRAALPQEPRSDLGTGGSTPPAPELPTGPPGEPGTYGMTQAARPTGFTPMPDEAREVTLYRASSPTVRFEDVFDPNKLTQFKPPKGVKGQFYASDLNTAEYFKDTYGKGATIKTIKIPLKDAKKYLTPEGEYYIPEGEGEVPTPTPPAPPPSVEMGTGARGIEPPPAAPPEEGGIPPTAPSIVPKKQGTPPKGYVAAVRDPETGDVYYTGSSHGQDIENLEGKVSDIGKLETGWVRTSDDTFVTDVKADRKAQSAPTQMDKDLAQPEKAFAPKKVRKAKAKEETAPAPKKQAWEMTPKEYMDDQLRQSGMLVPEDKANYVKSVKAAVAEGKPVPQNVLDSLGKMGEEVGPVHKPTIAIQLDDGTKLMKIGAESPEEVAIAHGVGPSRIRQVGEVTPTGEFKFDTSKSYTGKMAPELLDELLDVTKEKKKASRGRTKGLLQTALDSIDNQRGSTNIPTKAADAIIEMAQRAGKDIESLMRYLKFSDEDIVAVMQVAKEQARREAEKKSVDPYSDEAVAASLKEAKEYKRPAPTPTSTPTPPTISPETVIKHAGPNLEIANTAMRNEILKKVGGGKGLDRQLAYLRDTQRVVEPYKEGSKVLPDQQKPLISDKAPVDPEKDIKSYNLTESPGYWSGRKFSITERPVHDMLESQMAMAWDTKEARKWSKDVLDPFPDTSKETAKAMEGVMNKHKDVIEKDNLLHDQLKVAIKREKEMAKGSPLQVKAGEDIYRLQGEIKALAPSVDRAHADARSTINDLARKNSDTRVLLDAGGELPKGVVASAEEHAAALKLREYFDRSGGVMKEEGLPVFEQGSYIPHLFKSIAGDVGANTLAHSFIKSPDLLKFMSRSDNSIPWLPSAHGVMKAYIPVAEYKMAYQPFLNRWKPFIETSKNKVLREGLNKWIDKNMNREMPENFERVINAVVSAEYMRLIGLSPSVGFKHILKLGNTLSEYGYIDTSRGAMRAAKIPVQYFMEKFGLEGKHAELDAYRTFVNMSQLVRMSDETPIIGAVKYRLKSIMGNPVTLVEMIDNGVSVMSGIVAGARRGIDPAIIHAHIWDTIRKANFRSGPDQPLWQKSTGARAFTMFQSTPFKLAEYKLDLVRGMIKDISSGFKSPEGVDAFGTHYTTKVLRYLSLVGVAEAVAQANDTSVVEMFAHLPFLSHIIEGKEEGGIGFGSPEPALESPVSQLASQLKHNTVTPEGLLKTAKSHFKDMGVGTKIRRIMQDDIPEGYDSAGKYLTGLRRLGYSYRDKKVKGIY